ncbi:ABC multidrug transporter [Seiridium cupressi]
MEKYFELLGASQHPYYLMFRLQQWLELVLDLMVAVFAVIHKVLAVELRSQFSPGFVALALLNGTSFNINGVIARVKGFCEETKNENLASEISLVPEQWPSYGHVSTENLTDSYDSEGEHVLHKVTIDIPPALE